MTDYSFITGEKPKKKPKKKSKIKKRKEKNLQESFNDISSIYKSYKKLLMPNNPKSWNEKDIQKFKEKLRKNPAYTHELKKQIERKLREEKIIEKEIDYIIQMKEWEYNEKQRTPSKFKKFMLKLKS